MDLDACAREGKAGTTSTTGTAPGDDEQLQLLEGSILAVRLLASAFAADSTQWFVAVTVGKQEHEILSH